MSKSKKKYTTIPLRIVSGKRVKEDIKKLSKEQNKILNKNIKHLLKHFTLKKDEGGWPLEFNSIVSDVYSDLLDINLFNIIAYKLLTNNKNLQLITEDGSWVIKKKK